MLVFRHEAEVLDRFQDQSPWGDHRADQWRGASGPKLGSTRRVFSLCSLLCKMSGCGRCGQLFLNAKAADSVSGTLLVREAAGAVPQAEALASPLAAQEVDDRMFTLPDVPPRNHEETEQSRRDK